MNKGESKDKKEEKKVKEASEKEIMERRIVSTEVATSAETCLLSAIRVWEGGSIFLVSFVLVRR